MYYVNEKLLVLPGTHVSFDLSGNRGVLKWSEEIHPGTPSMLEVNDFRMASAVVRGLMESTDYMKSWGTQVSEILGYMGDREVLRAIGNQRALSKAFSQASPGKPVLLKGDLLRVLQKIGSGGYRLLSAPGVTEYRVPSVPGPGPVRGSRVTGLIGNPRDLSLSLTLKNGESLRVIHKGVTQVDSLVVKAPKGSEIPGTPDDAFPWARIVRIDLLHHRKTLERPRLLDVRGLVLAKIKDPKIKTPFVVKDLVQDLPMDLPEVDPLTVTLELLSYYYSLQPPTRYWNGVGGSSRIIIKEGLKAGLEPCLEPWS